MSTKTRLADNNSDRLEKISLSEEAVDFDPDRSNRETRKLARKIYTETKRGKSCIVYDSNGMHLPSGKDLCDCLDLKCEGCHFPCLKCRSLKCGHECRTNRRWQYEHNYQTERLPCPENETASKPQNDEEIQIVE